MVIWQKIVVSGFTKNVLNVNSWHFSYLCTHDPKIKDSKKLEESKTDKKVQSAEVTHDQVKTGNVMVIGSVTSCMGDSVLPTFTCKSKNKNFRGLLDYGSQGNFITMELASKLNCKVIQDGINVDINGFNASRKYKTKLVEVELGLGNETYNVPAICVPSIDVNISVPNLSKLAQAFQNRGYDIADLQLLSSDTISDIEFVLGTASAHCLLTSARTIGDVNPVVYLDSPIGILFMGNVNLALEHISSVDYCQPKTEFRLASFLCTQPREYSDEWQENLVNQDSNLVLKVKKKSIDKDLNAITDQALVDNVNEVLNYENLPYEEDSELNSELVKNT